MCCDVYKYEFIRWLNVYWRVRVNLRAVCSAVYVSLCVPIFFFIQLTKKNCAISFWYRWIALTLLVQDSYSRQEVHSVRCGFFAPFNSYSQWPVVCCKIKNSYNILNRNRILNIFVNEFLVEFHLNLRIRSFIHSFLFSFIFQIPIGFDFDFVHFLNGCYRTIIHFPLRMYSRVLIFFAVIDSLIWFIAVQQIRFKWMEKSLFNNNKKINQKWVTNHHHPIAEKMTVDIKNVSHTD